MERLDALQVKFQEYVWDNPIKTSNPNIKQQQPVFKLARVCMNLTDMMKDVMLKYQNNNQANDTSDAEQMQEFQPFINMIDSLNKLHKDLLADQESKNAIKGSDKHSSFRPSGIDSNSLIELQSYSNVVTCARALPGGGGQIMELLSGVKISEMEDLLSNPQSEKGQGVGIPGASTERPIPRPKPRNRPSLLENTTNPLFLTAPPSPTPRKSKGPRPQDQTKPPYRTR